MKKYIEYKKEGKEKIKKARVRAMGITNPSILDLFFLALNDNDSSNESNNAYGSVTSDNNTYTYDKNVMEKFENTSTYSYNEITETKNMDDNKCSICKEHIKPENDDNYNKKTITKLSCGHIFHTLCVMKWIKGYSDKCPLCGKIYNNNK